MSKNFISGLLRQSSS